MNIYDIRRENARFLAKEIGGICAFAKKLRKSQSQISHLIGSKTRRKIGDNLSFQIEKAFNKSRGWLDQNNNEPSYKSVPLITWQEVTNWCNFKSKINSDFNYVDKVPVTTNVGSNSYALRIENDCMESNEGISFFKNSIIIVDPDQVATNGDFIITHINNTEFVTFRQLNIDGGIFYAKPLNKRYPIFEIRNAKENILGVICQQYVEIKLLEANK